MTESGGGKLPGGLQADRVLPNSPGQHAGIRLGDLLTGATVLPDRPARRNPLSTEPALLNDAADQNAEIQSKTPMPKSDYAPIAQVADLMRVLDRTEVYGKASYRITRAGVLLDTPVVVIPEPADRSLARAQRIIGLIYLAIGIYVLFRRWTAPRATHFYLFCLVSFCAVHAQIHGRVRWAGLDVYWLNVVAEALQPALFLHFALSFPEERFKQFKRRFLLPLVYAPGAALLGLWVWTIATRAGDRACCGTGWTRFRTAYVAVFYILAALFSCAATAAPSSPAAAPAAEVGYARNRAGGAAVHGVLLRCLTCLTCIRRDCSRTWRASRW